MRQLLVSEEDALIVCEVIRIDVNAEAVEEDVVAAPPRTHAGSATGAAARTLLIHVEVYDELLPQPVGDECVRRDEFDSEGRTPQFVESEHEGTNRRAPKFCFPLLLRGTTRRMAEHDFYTFRNPWQLRAEHKGDIQRRSRHRLTQSTEVTLQRLEWVERK